LLTGFEISPGIGHFNAWPVTRNEERSDLYGLPFMFYDDTMSTLRNYEFPELWEFARADYGAQAIQLNHPRDWFAYVGYTPEGGIAGADPLRFSVDFDAVEVFNGPNSAAVLPFWFSFLDQGLTPTMHGNSDSHSYKGWIGDPRTLVAVTDDDPAEADAQEFIDSDLAQHAQVSSGPFIDFLIEDQPIGDLVTGLGGTQVELQIRVQAPTWMPVNYLKVYSNHGEVVYSQPLIDIGAVVRFDDTVVLQADQDAYFVVEAGHTSARLGPVAPGSRAFAITNPIWVDIDGDNEFDPPGL